MPLAWTRHFATEGMDMNQIAGSILIGVLMMGSPAFASSKLVKEKQCMQCHAVSKDTIGPSFKNIAKRWKGKEDAEKTLIATIQKLGGTPVMEKKLDDYAKALKADTLRNQGDVLDLAARLELGAINAYLGVIPAFGNKDLAKVAGRLAADETMHYTLLQNALGRPLPAGALSFGA